jgi:PHD/YefM family antitoxin component YafN of YafNO toxin-antitoxin module
MPRNLIPEKAVIKTHEEFIVDGDGKRKAVIVPWEEWQELLEALEELDDVKAYDEAKRQPSDPVPFDQAVREIREAE